MFRDAYRRDNAKIRPDEALVRHLTVKMEAEAGRIPGPVPPRRTGRRIAVLAACAALVFTAGALMLSRPRELGKPTAFQETTTYNQLYSLVKSLQPRSSLGEILEDISLYAGSKDGSMNMAPETTVTAGSTEYSSTNVQVDGVDEADVVKTDGEYIYTLADDRLSIVRAQGAEMTVVSSVDLRDANTEPQEFYLCGDRLVLLETRSTTSGKEGSRSYATVAAVYDVADRENPSLVCERGQSGYYLSSRLVGDILYLVTDDAVTGEVKKGKPESFAPYLVDGTSTRAMDSADIAVSENPQSSRYVVMTSLDVVNPEHRLCERAVFGGGAALYSNERNLLLAAYGGAQGDTAKTETTQLLRFALDKGEIALAATGVVPGRPLNQFSMDEYDGAFRIVTTEDVYKETERNGVISYSLSSTVNALFTLDESLQVIGSLRDLAPGERVYSVRFDGPIGYFVTFRQVDPLFTVDLSDPKRPSILSALKIPGFSDYLHPYAEGLLFGLGQDVDEQSGQTTGLKLSMFDVSNPADVTEVSKETLSASWSEASSNHKAILVSAEKELIAFPSNTGYQVYGYTPEEGFYSKALLEMDQTFAFSRGLYIGETFYLMTGPTLTAYALDDFQQQGRITLG